MDFDEFFNHPFIRSNTTEKPAPVSVDRYSNLEKPESSSSKARLHSRVSHLKQEGAASEKKAGRSSKPVLQPKQNKPDYSQPLSPKVADDFPVSAVARTTPPTSPQSGSDSDQFEDFVMINDDAVAGMKATSTAATVSSSHSQRIYNRTFRPLVNYIIPEPLPVPTQRAAFEQIQRSSGSNSSSIGVIPESESTVGNKSAESSNSTMLTSPPATPPQSARTRRISQVSPGLKRQDSCSSIGSTESGCSRGSRHMLVTDVSQMSPPVNFVLGTSPTAGGIALSPSSSYAMNRSRRPSVPHSPNQPQVSPSFFNWLVLSPVSNGSLTLLLQSTWTYSVSSLSRPGLSRLDGLLT